MVLAAHVTGGGEYHERRDARIRGGVDLRALLEERRDQFHRSGLAREQQRRHAVTYRVRIGAMLDQQVRKRLGAGGDLRRRGAEAG